MANIFASYSQKDREWVRRLVETLERLGWSVWWDSQILPGEQYDLVIERELDAAVCIIVVWSKNSLVSKNVRNEAIVGRQKGCLIQVSIEGTSLPSTFAGWQAVDLSTWDGGTDDPRFQQLSAGIRRLVGPPDSTEFVNMYTFRPEEGVVHEGIKGVRVYDAQERLERSAIAVGPLKKHYHDVDDYSWEPVPGREADIVWEHPTDCPRTRIGDGHFVAGRLEAIDGRPCIAAPNVDAGLIIRIDTGLSEDGVSERVGRAKDGRPVLQDHGCVLISSGASEGRLIAGSPYGGRGVQSTASLWWLPPTDGLLVRGRVPDTTFALVSRPDGPTMMTAPGHNDTFDALTEDYRGLACE